MKAYILASKNNNTDRYQLVTPLIINETSYNERINDISSDEFLGDTGKKFAEIIKREMVKDINVLDLAIINGFHFKFINNHWKRKETNQVNQSHLNKLESNIYSQLNNLWIGTLSNN